MYTPPVTSLQVTLPGLQGARPSLFDIRLNDATGALFGPAGTLFDGWCLAMNTFLDVNTASTGTVFSSYETGTLSIAGLPIGVGASGLANMDSINWLINEYDGVNYTWGEIQATMWNLLGFDWTLFSNALGNPDPARITALSGQALANDGFVPDVGQILGVVLDVYGAGIQQQTALIETRAAKLGDRVWDDSNANGVQEDGEQGISGAVVRLVRDINQDGDFNDANELLQTTTTDAQGNYSFKGLAPSLEYQVQFSTPTGYNGTSPRQAGGTAAIDSDGLVSEKIVLAAGEYNTSIDSGFYKFASLGDRVWLDTNGNGQQDFGEGGRAGVTVNLLDSAGNLITSQLSGVGGAYLFSNLVPGSYLVEFVAPAGLGFTVANVGPDANDSDADQGNGRTGPITLSSGQDERTVDAGLVAQAPQVGNISGRVLEDRDNNNTGDTPIAGVTVILKRPDGSEVARTTSDGAGNYNFPNVPAGDYTVHQTNLPGYNDVADTDGGDPNLINVTVPAGGSSTGNDFIDERKASLGDRVWLDQDGDGQQEPGDTSISGVVVNLLDAAGVVIETQTTSDTGNYLFTNLDAGTYSIEFVKPAGYDFTVANQGVDATDSDADATSGRTGTYTLAGGDENLTVDAGLRVPAPQPSSISGKVLEDRDNNNTGDTPIAGVTVILKRPDGSEVARTTSDGAGNYNFPNVPAGDYTVHQTNLPGYNDVADTDGGDPNLINVTVPAGGSSTGNDFIDERKASLGDRVWLDQDGDGQQEPGDTSVAGVVVNLLSAAGAVIDTQTTNNTGNYLFTNLDAGTYSIEFVKPAGYDFTVANQGLDATDSDADVTSGRTGTYTLLGGDENLTVDAGLKLPPAQPGSVSGRVLEDRDNNNTGDVPIAGVTVILKRPDGSEVARTTTDGAGNYSFPNVPAGNYTVHQTNLPGYNDVADTDGGDPNLISVSVPAGGSSTGNDFIDDRKASLGDRVWFDDDANGQLDGIEAGVQFITVKLLDAADNVLDTQVTDSTGNYLFSNLDAGTYRVEFSKFDGLEFTPANVGPDDSDSDADVTTGRTGLITLVSGQNERTVDAGLRLPAPQLGSVSGQVLEDRDNNNTGDVPIAGVTVVLKRPDGSEVARTTTDTNGNYNFPNVPAGNYTVHQTNLPGYNDVADKDGGDPNSIAVTVPAGGNSPDNNFIDERKASLGDRVWLDQDGDGQQEPGDISVSGVKVNLLNAAGAVIDSQTTNANGNYLFTGLDAGTYSVEFHKPAGYDFTVANQGVDATDSDANVTTGRTGTYTLLGGDENLTVDAGLRVPAPQPGSVSGKVLEDRDNNNTGDTPIAGVTVILKRPDGSEVARTTTDGAGNYNFPNVPAGNYTVHQTNLPGYNDVADKDGGDPNSIAVTVPAGGNSPDNNFIDERKASLGDRVWLDQDGDGQQEPGDISVSGVKVNLLNAAGAVIDSQTTNANGNYLFTGLDAGTYSVEFHKPAGYDFTVANQGVDATDSDANVTTGRTGTYTLLGGDENLTVDAGLRVPAPQPGSVSGKVLEDRDNNNTGDVPIAGVTVVLKRPDGSEVARTTTDTNGNYNFPNVPAGNYTVHQTNLPGYNDVADKDGGDPNSIAVTVPAGGNSPDNNFIDERKASLGDRVWLDQDGDGQQEPGDISVSGVKVNLLNAAGNVVASQTTNANGNYLFTGLDAGTYSVEFVKPAGYDFTVANQGADGTDSDANVTTGRTGTYTLLGGDDNRTVDAGLRVPAPKPGSVSGKVLEDRDNNNTGDVPIAGVTVVLKRPDGSEVARTTTDSNGHYNFPNVPAGNYTVHQTSLPGYNDVGDKDGGDPNSIAVTVPAGGNSPDNNFIDERKASLGDRVWLDQDGDGQQEPGDISVSGVKVNLLNAAGNVVASQTTNANGNYLFTGLDAGTYSVEFVKPAGYDFTVANQGADGTDSDANVTTGRTGTYTLLGGDDNRTVDAGLRVPAPKPGSVSGKVLEDRDNNGTGDTPIAGVTVVLRRPDGSEVARTTTDHNGHYNFPNVPAGNYTVHQTNLPGYNDVGDRDGGDPNRIAVTVPAGGQSTDNNFVDDRPAALGDRVYMDTNGNGQQDQGEGGVGGVKVNLLNAAGTVVSSQTTNGNGDYLFTGLDAGTYSVQFVKPAGTNFTVSNVGNDATDSDANQATGRTGTYTLVSGQTERTVDAGLVKVPVADDCVKVTFDFSGKTAMDGADGNSRSWTNTATGVTVTARAFSQDKGTNKFEAAYLGSFGGGLGVTDKYEGDGSKDNAHTVDNIGRNNYIVFQFSKAVEVDKALLGYVAGDSDIQIWVGNSSSTLTSLSSSVLSSASFTEVNTTTLSGSRTADINGEEVRGNIFIIAADTTDTTPEDFFKLDQLLVCVPVDNMPQPPKPVAKGSIGDFVFEDKNYNGVHDSGEAGMRGVTVKLLNAAGKEVASTTTSSTGAYTFNGLDAGNYKVQVVAPAGFHATRKDQGGNDQKDSDINASGMTDTITLAAGQTINTVDAGLYRKASIGDKVFSDWDHDGIFDKGEAAVRGVRVLLQNSSGVTIATTTTDSQGMYKFSDLDPGSYRIGFDKSNAVQMGDNKSVRTWQWAKVNVGSDHSVDSDATAAATAIAYTPYTTLESGEYDNTWDVGVTPIVIDLGGDGIQTISRSNAGGSFDLLGNGNAMKSGWISGNDAFLAVDVDGNGKIDSGAELFGGGSKGAGYAKLAGYDSNGDGLVDLLDTDFAQLLVWQDANGNHQTDAGELRSLAEAGVTSLSLALVDQPFYVDSQGNVHGETSSATLASGQTVTMTDVYFSVDKSDALAAGAALPSISELLGTGECELDALVGASGSGVSRHQMDDGCAEAGELLRKLSALSRADMEQHAGLAA